MLFLVLISNDGSTTSDLDSGSSYEIRSYIYLRRWRTRTRTGPRFFSGPSRPSESSDSFQLYLKLPGIWLGSVLSSKSDDSVNKNDFELLAIRQYLLLYAIQTLTHLSLCIDEEMITTNPTRAASAHFGC